MEGTTTRGAKSPEKAESILEVKPSPMRRQILKTLWTKQVNRYEEFLKGKLWSFRINSPDPNFLEWRKAATELILDGLVMESDSGYIYLTPKGFEYCKEHHKEFGEAEYWTEETIKEEMLQKVLAETGEQDGPADNMSA